MLRQILFQLYLLTSMALNGQFYRGLYVNDFEEILSDSIRVDQLFQWSEQEEINAFSIYDLHIILNDSTNYEKLRNFISKARNHGIEKVIGVVGGSYTFEYCFLPYQESTKEADSQFDGVNMEFEWWVGKDHFSKYETAMNPLIANQYPIETYIGWFSKGKKQKEKQATYLVNHSDIISIHAYQKKPTVSYIEDRVSLINTIAKSHNKIIDLVIIFSVEQKFSGHHSALNDYDSMFESLKKKMSPLAVSNVNIIGWKVFCYTDAIKHRPLKSDG
jgi:hypothetical protein